MSSVLNSSDKCVSPIELKYLKKYIKLNLFYDHIDDFFEMKKNEGLAYILDIFDSPLPENDQRLELLDDELFLYKNERKFLKFHKRAFTINNKMSIIDFGQDGIQEKINIGELGPIINCWDTILDQPDKYYFLEILLSINGSNRFYKTNNNICIELFTKIMYRNFYNSPSIIFTKYPMISIPKYGPYFLLIMEKMQDINIYKEIAEDCGLYLRI